MKKWILFILMAIVITSCGSKNNTENKRCIMVSILPHQYFLERIVGNKFEVKCMLSKGGNPETYDPSMTYMMNLEKSEAYFMTGNLGFEISIRGKIRDFNPNIKIFDTSNGVDLIKGSHNFDGDDEHGVDPHIWTSIVNVRVIIKNMLATVCELDPEDKDFYESNYKKFDAELSQLYDSLKERLKGKAGCAFVVWHPSLSYFARDFGLEQISLEHSGKESSMKYFEDKISYATKRKAKVFFVENNMDKDKMTTIGIQIGASLVTVNPLDYAWEKQIKIIADAIVESK